jgi:hypothetical protein
MLPIPISRPASALLAVCVCASLLVAQSGDGGQGASAPVGSPADPGTVGQATLAPLAAGPVTDWHVPIHTAPADPVGGAYGTWAAELTFKASFHDGFVFYPFLGASHATNLPLRWTTESVTSGGEPQIDCTAAPAHGNTATRYEYRFGGMVEAYDVRPEGVEQSFLIARRPTVAGDLVITGRVDTQLASAAVAAARQALVFSDTNGEPLVSYGEAVAIDAAGRRFDVLTSFDGSRVRLSVPAASVANATFPLLVDPLLTRVVIATWGAATFGQVSYPEVGRDDESTADNVMTFYSRQFSATDFDGYARLSDDDFTGSSLIYTDVTTSWSTVRAGTAFVGAADRWVLCLQRNFTSTVRVRALFHDKANVTLNSGLLVFHDPSAGECNWFPAVGGTNGFSASGDNALLVYQADVSATVANTTTSQVYAVLCDAAARTIGTRFELDNGVTTGDNEYPDVNQESNGGTASWVVAWEQFNNSITNDDVDVILTRVDYNGTVAGNLFAGPATGSPTHKLQPQVSGRGGRYAVSMIRSNTRSSNGGGFGSEILIERFDWSETAATPTKLGPNTLVADLTSPNFVNGGLAFDDRSLSHWALVYQRGGFSVGDCRVLRVGFTGGQTEAATLYSGPNGAYSPGICFNDDADEFLCVYGSTDNPPSGLPVYGHRLLYPTAASNVIYGPGCGPAGISSSTPPYAGSEFYRVNLTGIPATLSVFILSAAQSPFPIPLGAVGMSGCFGNIDLSVQLGSLSSVTNSVTFELPDSPLVIGDFFGQWAYFDAGLNPAGLGATAGIRVQVR